MSRLRALVYKEWRDQRALILGAVGLFALVIGLGKILVGKRFDPELRSPILAVCLGLFAILLATETIARDAHNGFEGKLGRLPVSRTLSWFAKASFITLGSAGCYLALLLLELVMRSTEGQRAYSVPAIAPEVLILIAAVAASCFASVCILKRSLPAAFLGIVMLASVPVIANLLPPWRMTEWLDVLLCTWTPSELAPVGMVACLLGSLFSFRVRSPHRSGLRRVIGCGLGASVVLVPLCAATVRRSAWALDIKPFSPRAEIQFAVPSPNGRFIAVQAGQEWDPSSNWIPRRESKLGYGPRWRREVWILDRSTGTWNEIDGRYRLMNREHPWDESGLLATISTIGAFGDQECAVERIDPRSGMIVSAREQDLTEAVRPWYQKIKSGKNPALRWPARNVELSVPVDSPLCPSSEPGIVLHGDGEFLVRHDMGADCVTRLAALHQPREHRVLLESPDCRWVLLIEGKGDQRLINACDGRVLRAFDTESGWCGWSQVPGRVCTVWHPGEQFTALNEDGTETPMPARGFDWRDLGLESPAQHGGWTELGSDRLLFWVDQCILAVKLDGSEREVLYQTRP